MITFANKHGDHESVLEVLVSANYNVLVLQFEVIQKSCIVGETQFNLKCRSEKNNLLIFYFNLHQ